MGYGTRQFHAWFKNNKVPSYLTAYMKKYRVPYTDAVAYTTDENKQSLIFHFLRAVPFSEIEDENLWNEDRINQINKWASEDTLLRLPIDRFGTNSCYIPNHHVPSLERRLTKDTWDKPPKYKIVNGIHRIHAAKKLGLKYIFAEVSELFSIGKDEMMLNSSEKRKKKKLGYLCKFCNESINSPELFFHHLLEEHDLNEFINKKILDEDKNQHVSRNHSCPHCRNSKHTKLLHYYEEQDQNKTTIFIGMFLCTLCNKEWKEKLEEDFWQYEMFQLLR